MEPIIAQDADKVLERLSEHDDDIVFAYTFAHRYVGNVPQLIRYEYTRAKMDEATTELVDDLLASGKGEVMMSFTDNEGFRWSSAKDARG